MNAIKIDRRYTHEELHTERIERAKGDVRTATVYESTGSDGYTPGTWGYQVSVGGWDNPVETWADGGYGSRDHAAEVAATRGRS